MKGWAGTMTHDYKRNGTTTLFAALNVATGRIIGQCMGLFYGRRHLKAERLGDPQINQQVELDRLHNPQVGGPDAFQDAADVRCRPGDGYRQRSIHS